jgi:hypothetical protein
MIGEQFLRDFFGISPSQYELGGAYKQPSLSPWVTERCAELTKGWHPQTNVIPVLEMLAIAERNGWDIIQRAKQTKNQSKLTP